MQSGEWIPIEGRKDLQGKQWRVHGGGGEIPCSGFAGR